MTDLRLHLPAKIPSEGARRLAWWLMTLDREARATAPATMGVSAGLLVRLVAGEIDPGEALRARIARRSAREVIPADWDAAPEGRWWDMPVRGEIVRTPDGLRRVTACLRAA